MSKLEYEYEVRTIPVDENALKTVTGWANEGWQLVPGITPVSVYHLVRQSPKVVAPDLDVGNAKFEMHIDDTKVHILRANGTLE